MKRLIHLGLFLVLVVVVPLLANDGQPSEVRNVEVFPGDGEVRVEITLSSVVTPSVESAQHPDRLVVKLPGTSSSARQRRINVGQLGVRSVRYGLNQADPPETHLVVDLDQEHDYKVSTSGNRIIFLLKAPLSIAAKQHHPPAGAASRPIIAKLGADTGSHDSQPESNSSQEAVLLNPPPSGSPIKFPAGSGDNQTTAQTRTSSGPPSAKHPNYGSLQEGTVFPAAGSPSSGTVPPVSGIPAATPLEANSQASTTPPVSTEPALPALPQGAKSDTPASTNPVPSRLQDAAVLSPSSGQKAAGIAEQSSTPVVAPPPTAEAASLPTSQPKAVISAVGLPSPEFAPTSTVEDSPVQVAAEEPAPEKPQEVAEAPAKSEPQPSAEASTATQRASREPPAAEQPLLEAGGGRAPQLMARAGENPDFRTAFRVKYVAEDAAYLDGGRAAGLAEGMKLVIRDLPNVGAVATVGSDSDAAGDVAELVVLSVAETSAVTEIHTPKRPVKVGDLAYLSSTDQQALVEKNALSATRKYPAVVSFTENDTLDDEARTEVPKPPLPSVNRARGRIGFDYIGVMDHSGSGMTSTNLGTVVRADITRIYGTYWNVSGYWRGRFDRSTGPQTLEDTINRTYHLYTSYDNPNSAWVAGFGRMYLPWATSLETIDGGYFGRKLKPGVTSGVFLGSTPDPTSYSYAPNQQIGGGFINFEGGSYDDVHYSSTSGGGANMLSWSLDRPFAFFENSLFYKRVFSVYQATQVDNKQGYWYFDPTRNKNVWQPGTGWGAGRAFTTVRVQPHPRIEFDFNHTYFRDLPTFDPSLIATGLLDKYLFQGFSAGARVEVLKQVWVSSETGLSNHSGDKGQSLNEMVGLTFAHLPWIGLHTDLHYSRFNSSFGSGSYESIGFSKEMGETLQLQFMAGQQSFDSALTNTNRSRFINGMLENALGQHYFMQFGGTISRGGVMNYDQWIVTFGYRFDNRHGHRGQ
jgi:hypothetical protein